MALTQRLELRQGQSLVMTPQLQQAIKLLQLSNLELADYVEQELERNPLLERDESDPTPREESGEQGKSTESETLDQALAREDFSRAEDMDAERSDLYAEEGDRSAPPAGNTPLTDWTTVRGGGSLDGDGENALERTLSQAPSLKDHLTEQLTIAALDAGKRMIGAALIDAIDEAGYLRAELFEVAERLGA